MIFWLRVVKVRIRYDLETCKTRAKYLWVHKKWTYSHTITRTMLGLRLRGWAILTSVRWVPSQMCVHNSHKFAVFFMSQPLFSFFTLGLNRWCASPNHTSTRDVLTSHLKLAILLYTQSIAELFNQNAPYYLTLNTERYHAALLGEQNQNQNQNQNVYWVHTKKYNTVKI